MKNVREESAGMNVIAEMAFTSMAITTDRADGILRPN
jgi:hypothetical protein